MCRRILACLAFLLVFATSARASWAVDLDSWLPESREAKLVVWNRHVATFRVPFGEWTPQERADRAAARIRAIQESRGAWNVARRTQAFGELDGYVLEINGEFALRLLPGDVDSEAGETLELAAERAEARLNEALAAQLEQRNWKRNLIGAGVVVGTTLLFAASIYLVTRVRRRMRDAAHALFSKIRVRFRVAGMSVMPVLGGLGQMLGRLLSWGIVGLLAYVWLALVLEPFPYTEPWGDALGRFLLQVLGNIGWSMLAALPDLFVVFLIVALTLAFNRGVGAYFLTIERGEESVAWLTPETARASRQLLSLLMWVFALVLAYPYIPGSDSAAFKGVSVLFGLMVSLGSAGLVNQVMSGLTVIYSRAFRHGEFVRIGDHEGRVTNVGLLATTIRRPGGLEVAIPNAVVTAHTITNFSRASAGRGEALVTSVTIGYDAPWRQVHALLLLAAERTSEVAKEPAPFVLQRALSDFYVEYELHAEIVKTAERDAAVSRLHAAIQDAFNERGVQIMSPHFVSQPGAPVVVPKAAWFAAPAHAEDASGSGAGASA